MKLNRYNQFLKENNQFNYDSVDEFLANPGTHWGLILNYSIDNVSGVQYIGKFEGDNYEQIITNHPDWIYYLQEDLAEMIKNCCLGSSYSDLCKKKNDPEQDFIELQKDIDESGWNLNSIVNLFQNKVSPINFEDFIHSYGLDSKNGMVDIYLYKLSEQLGMDADIVELGGGGWSEYATNEEEVLIRYSYGYHHTKYGELMLKQAGISKENFIGLILKRLREELIEGLDEIQEISIDRFFIEDFDRLIIEVNQLLEEIHNYGVESDDINFMEMSREDLLAMITNVLSDHCVKLEIIDTGNDIILYDKKIEE